MSRLISIFAGIFLAIIFQVSILPLCFPKDSIPDLMLIFLIALTAIFGFPRVLFWAVLAGFFLDIFSFQKIGVNIISFVVFCYFVSFFSRRVILGEKSGGILIDMIFISLVTFFNNFWLGFCHVNFKVQEIWDNNFFVSEQLFGKIVFNLILFFVLLIFLKRLEKKLSIRKLFPEK